MIISLSGKPGSGKSTVALRLANALGYERYYMGGIRRELARKRGMTLEQYNALGEKDPSTDHDVDGYQENLGKTKDNFVIEGRTSFYFIPNSFKIFLDVNEEEGARRVLSDMQKNGQKRNEAHPRDYALQEIVELNRKRMASDNVRYKKYYNLDALDPSHYDAWIDTTNLSPDAVFQAVVDVLEKLSTAPHD